MCVRDYFYLSKSLIVIYLLALVSTNYVNAQSLLPPCPSNPQVNWDNCLGRHGWGEDEYFGEWKNNHLVGHGILFLRRGGYYVGEFNLNRRNGLGIELSRDLNVLREGIWKNDEFISKSNVDIERFRISSEFRRISDQTR